MPNVESVPLPWGRMAFLDTPGTGVPLMLLPGTGCDIRDWAEVAAGLPERRIVCLDWRGHGVSDRPAAPFTLDDLASDVLALAEVRALHRVLLVGHSLGGMVALAAAARSPQVVGLVLLEGWTNARAQEAFREPRTYGRLDPAAIARIEEKAERTVRRFPPAVWDALRGACHAFDARPYLQRAAIPILEVYGTAGRTPETNSALQLPSNPSLALHWIAEAGHYLPHECPAEVARLCAQAAEGIERRRAK